LHESAISDLEDVIIWFNDQGAPEANVGAIHELPLHTAEIIAQAERLCLYPDSGRVVPEFGVAFA
jgi:hypothetical protein